MDPAPAAVVEEVTIWSKTWTSPDFPGMTIKSILKMDGPTKIETTVETTSVTIK